MDKYVKLATAGSCLFTIPESGSKDAHLPAEWALRPSPDH